MKKISYRSRPVDMSPRESLQETIAVGPSAEGYSSGSPGGGIGRGLSLPGEPTQAFDEDSEPQLLGKLKEKKRGIDSDKLVDLFVMLADEMDDSGEYHMANFADFMIKKIAQQKSLNYSELFKDLLVKIVESDILDKNKLVTMLVNIFNKTVILNVNNNVDLDKAKLEAYQAAVSRAKEYVK